MDQTDLDKRFTYHKPREGQAEKYLVIRAVAQALAEMIDQECPDGREKSLAITAVEQAVMWANAGIARS